MTLGMGTVRAITALWLGLLLAPPTTVAQPRCPPLDVQLHTRHMDAFLQGAGGRVVRPVVLFLPGTPGSMLVRRADEEVLFGKGRVDAGKLQLADPRNRDVDATVLEKFSALAMSEDVYGRTIQELRDGVGTSGELHTWGYDWRLAAGDIANALQKHLQEDFAGRDVVLVAHSFGAFVAWRWQEEHDPAVAGVEHLVMFGPPLGGTCEAARLLLKGYGPAAGEPNDWITKLGYRVLMGELRLAAFTFPSSYQLIPRDGCLEKLTLRPGARPDRSPLAARSLEFWTSPLGRQIVDDAWKELEVTPEAFWSAVERAIDEANRSTPDPSRRRVRNVRAFFSTDNPTARQIQLVVDGSEYIVPDDAVEKAGLGDDNPVVVTAPGDGRVVACEAPACNLKDLCVDRISLVHGRLAESEQFRSYVRYVLPPMLKALAVRAAVQQTQSTDDLPGVDWTALRDEVAATGIDSSVFDRLTMP